MLIQTHAHTLVWRWITGALHFLFWGSFFLKLLFITPRLSFSLLMSVTLIMSRVCMHTEVTYIQDIRKTVLFSVYSVLNCESDESWAGPRRICACRISQKALQVSAEFDRSPFRVFHTFIKYSIC